MVSVKKIIFTFCIMIVLVACDSGKELETPTLKNPESEREKNITIIEETEIYKNIKLPQNVEEFAAFPVGKYGGIEEAKTIEAKTIEEVANEISEVSVEGLSDEERKNLYISALFSLTKREMMGENIQAVFKETDVPTITEEEKKLFKENYNVEILLDASGSMVGKVDGETKMEAAKKAINEFASSLPKEANVSLTVYGHKGSNEEKDKQASCSQIDTIYSNQKYDATKFSEALNTFKPTGWTPLTGALEKSLQNFANSPGDKNTNIIYVVSDGIETCGGNPVEVAKKMQESNIQPIVNIIGFDVDDEAQKQLKEITDVTKGKYIQANNVQELKQEFNDSIKKANKWKSWYIHNKSNAIDIRVSSISKLQDIKIQWKKQTHLQRRFTEAIWKKVSERKGFSDSFQKNVEVTLYEYMSGFFDNKIDNYIDQKKHEIEKKEKEFNEQLKDKSQQGGGQ